MSNLKVYHCNEWHNEYTEFYMKSEADKVIEELEAKIERTKNSPCNDGEKCNAYWKLYRENTELKAEIERLKKENEMTLVGVNLRSPTSDGRFI